METADMKPTPAKITVHCLECQAGQMHKKYVTYYTWLAEELITVPNFPAWVCDVCGRREYDPHAVSQLRLILSPNSGRGSRKGRRPAPPEAPGDASLPTHPK